MIAEKHFFVDEKVIYSPKSAPKLSKIIPKITIPAWN